jgi:hypothetical protein
MKCKIPLSLSILCIFNSYGVNLKYKHGKDIFQLKNAHYFISNPRYLCKGTEAYDTSNAMFSVISSEIASALKKRNINNWTSVSAEMDRKMTVGFNQTADRKTGFVDSLPYTTREYCIENNITTFIAFYLYQENMFKDIKDGNEKNIRFSFPVTDIFGNIVLSTFSITITIDLSNVQLCLAVYDVASNNCLFFKRTDDEDYVSLEEIVKELFQKL